MVTDWLDRIEQVAENSVIAEFMAQHYISQKQVQERNS